MTVRHGRSHTHLHRAWIAMKNRCLCPTSGPWPHYGGRGIGVCVRWAESFEAFAADVGEPPSPRHSLDRIDVNGDYKPGNCRWATVREQHDNRRVTLFVECFGERRTLREWAAETDIAYFTLRARMRRGWEARRALTTPPDGRKS
jgi:hypothetical protein